MSPATSVVADTVTLLRYLQAPSLLSARAVEVLEAASVGGDPILVSAISLTEVANLVDVFRLTEADLAEVDAALDAPDSPFDVVPVDLAVARAFAQVPYRVVANPADRIIAATALVRDVPLVTPDAELRSLGAPATIW